MKKFFNIKIINSYYNYLLSNLYKNDWRPIENGFYTFYRLEIKNKDVVKNKLKT